MTKKNQRSEEENAALHHRLAMYQQLGSLYPLEHEHLQKQIEIHLLLQQNEEAELLLGQLEKLLISLDLSDEADKAANIQTHLRKEELGHKLYSTPFLHLASSNFFEKVFHQHRRIEIEEGEYLIHYGAKETQMFILVQGELAIWSRDDHGAKHFEHGMQAGEVIGELAFLDNTARTADVIACCKSTVLALPGKAVLKLFIENPAIEQALRFEADKRKIQMDLKKNTALSHLPKNVQSILAKHGRYAHYKTLERIYQSEQNIETIDLICEGNVRLVGELHDGSSLILNSLKSGTVLGCSATIEDMEVCYTADHVSMSNTTLIRFPVAIFKKIMVTNPRFYQAMLMAAEFERGCMLQSIQTQNLG